MVADEVTFTETCSLGDHLFMHHHFDGALVGGLSDKRREEEHAHRHSEAWTSFHGPSQHTHPVPHDDGPLRILLQSAACNALPDEVISAHDAVADAVLAAFERTGYRVVRV